MSSPQQPVLPTNLKNLYTAVTTDTIDWATLANLNIQKVSTEGLGAAIMALRAPKKMTRKQYKALYREEAQKAAARRATRSQSRSRSKTPSSEIRRRRETLKKKATGKR